MAVFSREPNLSGYFIGQFIEQDAQLGLDGGIQEDDYSKRVEKVSAGPHGPLL